MHGWSLIGSLGSASVLFLPPRCLVPKSVVKPVRRLGTLWGGLREDSPPENLRAEQQGKGPGAGPPPWSQQPLKDLRMQGFWLSIEGRLYPACRAGAKRFHTDPQHTLHA